MDRRGKERLIGAAILVVLIVLVVPELLSGPKPSPPAPQPQQLPAPASNAEPVRNVTVDLATSKAPAAPDPEPASAPPVSAHAAIAPAPGVTQPPPEPSREAPSSSAAAPPPPAGSVESVATSPISKTATAHGEASRAPGWAVQLGSFASRANADNLVHQLKAQGFAVYVISGGSGAAARHRVRVGPLNDRDAAEHAAAKLKALGHASTLVAPGG